MSYERDFLYCCFNGNTDYLPNLLRHLRKDDGQIAQMLYLSPHTIRRWRLGDRKANPSAVKLLAILAGYMPWPGWQGWECENGYIFPPGWHKNGILPNEFFAVGYYRDLYKQFQKRSETLEAEVAKLKAQLEQTQGGEKTAAPRAKRRRRWRNS